jgi:hypothetical protein
MLYCFQDGSARFPVSTHNKQGILASVLGVCQAFFVKKTLFFAFPEKTLWRGPLLRPFFF